MERSEWGQTRLGRRCGPTQRQSEGEVWWRLGQNADRMSKPNPTKSTRHATPPSDAIARRQVAMIEDFRRCMHEGLREIKPDSAVLALGCEQAFLAAQLAEYSSDV